jgi:hypothetical protein
MLRSLGDVVQLQQEFRRKKRVPHSPHHEDVLMGPHYVIVEISGSHGDEYEDDSFLGCCAAATPQKTVIFILAAMRILNHTNHIFVCNPRL